MGAIFRGVFGYLFLVFLVRTAGRRRGRPLTPFEYILVFFIGGLALTSLVGNDRSMTNALCVVFGVAVTHLLIAVLRQRWQTMGRIFDGTPLILIKDGERVPEVMNGMRIQDDDIMASARSNGIKAIEQIQYAVLERNGEISVFSRE